MLDGQDAEQYFNVNRSKSGSNPDVYGWFQTRMVVQAGTEQTVPTFSETLHGLSVHVKNPVPRWMGSCEHRCSIGDCPLPIVSEMRTTTRARLVSATLATVFYGAQ